MQTAVVCAAVTPQVTIFEWLIPARSIGDVLPDLPGLEFGANLCKIFFGAPYADVEGSWPLPTCPYRKTFNTQIQDFRLLPGGWQWVPVSPACPPQRDGDRHLRGAECH